MDLVAHKKKYKGLKKKIAHFIKKMKKNPPEDLDYNVNKFNKEAFQEVDCKTCANCCKKMTPTFIPTDIKRISEHFQMSQKAFKKKYLKYIEEDKDWVVTDPPCPFLGEDNLCGIYEIRPADCREFPHTQKRHFDWHLDITKQNTEYCPAVMIVVEKMMEKFDS